MSLIAKYTVVFLAGFISVTLGIGAGFLVSLSAVEIVLIAGLGGMVGNILLVFVGHRFKSWILRRHPRMASDDEQSVESPGWARRVVAKYGAPGLGLLVCPVIGPTPAVALGMLFDYTRRDLLVWMSIGTFTWAIAMAALISLGLAVF